MLAFVLLKVLFLFFITILKQLHDFLLVPGDSRHAIRAILDVIFRRRGKQLMILPRLVTQGKASH